jgi:ribosomal protein S18 acetylase RimI-like enzyme
MEIRAATTADIDKIEEIDAIVESTQYLHLDRAADGADITWKLQQRPLREKLIRPNPLSADHRFTLKQIALGADDGTALVADYDGSILAFALAQQNAGAGVLQVLDFRVDYDYRRQGIASGLVFKLIQSARDAEVRALAAESLTNNFPASEFLAKLGFEIAGLDAKRNSNHDLVKEAVTLFWYLSLV